MYLTRILPLIFLSTTYPILGLWPFMIQPTKPFSVMLDPAGDAQTPGRIIGDSFERGITLQFAEQLKKRLEEQFPTMRVVLTRFPGETLDPLQNANFANRLKVDFYVSIHFYQEKESRPQMALYYFMYNPVTDLWSKAKPLHLYPYDQAHLVNITKTSVWADRVKAVVSEKKFGSGYDVKGPYGLPFRPLIGIKAPAIAIEIGLKNKNDWNLYIEPLAASIGHIYEVTQR